jgi:hypothetical protein
MSHPTPRRRTATERAVRQSLIDEQDTTMARDCDDLAEKMGWRIYRYEQGRATRTDVVLDRCYTHRARGLVLWWDLKSSTDTLTREQARWALDQNAAGVPAACGGVEELAAVLRTAPSGRMTMAKRAGEVLNYHIGKCNGRFRGEKRADADTLPPP